MKTTTFKCENKIISFNDKYLWLLLVISLSVRIYLGFITYVIGNDSIIFMQNAKYFADGEFSRGLSHPYHPLFSLFIAALHKVIPDLELSGTIISVFFGTLTVIAFYLIGKSVFGRQISFISATLLALHPYAARFSVDIITESTYFFFFISSFGFGFCAITKRKPLLFFLTGISSALAYLTRPEGIIVILIVVFWCLLLDFVKIRRVSREKLVSILILVVSFCFFAMPYFIYIKKETGSWALTKKKDTFQMIGIKERLKPDSDQISEKKTPTGQIHKEFVGKKPGIQKKNRVVVETSSKKENKSEGVAKQTAGRKSERRKHLDCFFHIINKYISTFHILLFIFFIIGIITWAKIGKEQFFGFYILTITALNFFIIYRLSISYFMPDGSFMYPSRRHLMPLIIPVIFCSGIGVYTTGAWIYEKLQSNKFLVVLKKKPKDKWLFQLIILMLVVCVLMPKTLKPPHSDKLGIKKAGQWVNENSDKSDPVILSSTPRVAYYADAKHVKIKGINDIFFAISKKRKVDFITITDSQYNVIEKALLQAIKNNKIKLVYKYPEEGPEEKSSILLYKVLDF
ncbi:MAG: ArnT family glycosyltransferase [Planctomycetota bacterium]|jgi:4-amino-4-deoxy-L-arabinose transferase-like glycosyltransferase